MKILLLTLVLGLGCVDAAITDVSKLSGKWITIYGASTDPQYLIANGPFEFLNRRIEFDEAKGTVTFKFFWKHNGECVPETATANHVTENLYVASFAGTSVIRFLYASEDALIAYFIQVDNHHHEHSFTLALFGKESNVSKRDMAEFQRLARELAIPQENVVNFLSRDDCPETF